MGPMPQKKVMMIHSTFHAPLRSARFTMSMMQRTNAIGCRKIASRTSTTNLIKARLVFHDRVQRCGYAWPTAGGCIRAVGRLNIGRFDPAAGDLPDRLQKAIGFGLGVVRGQARAHRTG